MTDHLSVTEDKKPPGLVRSSQNLGAGLFLMAIALFAFWQAQELPRGTLNAMGAGMLPQSLAAFLFIGGLALALSGLLVKGEAMERWSLRGPIFIFGGIILFSLLIRTCGLVIAGPVAMIFGSMASDEFNWKEATVFALILTGICILLFKVLLRLPIPVIGAMLEPFFPF